MGETKASIGLLMDDSQLLISLQELDTTENITDQKLQSSEEGHIANVCENEEKKSLYALRLKEFAPLTTLFRQVPLRAQHGFSTFDIRFNCIDVVEQYLCIGSNVGVVYVYNRKHQSMQRLRCEGYSSNITSIRILYSLDYLLACATESGTVFIFKLPASEQRKEVEKFQITGIHKHQITSLEWAQNGMKLFSGDAAGLVVYTEIDYLQNTTKSQEVLKEVYPVVQLSYRPDILLISTTDRLVLCHMEDSLTQVKQIGQKPRKCSGQFGAVFNQCQMEDEIQIYASRPGLRMWRAGTNGVVQETMLLKDIIAEQEANISLLNKPINPSSTLVAELQFGKLRLYHGLLLLTWNEKSLFIVDPEIKMVVGSCTNLKLVVDVAVCNDEIFVLQGQRHLIRIASAPEEENSFAEIFTKEPSVLVDFLSPFQELGNMFKTKASFQDSSADVFSWLHKKLPKTIPKDKQNEPSMIPLPEINAVNVNTVIECVEGDASKEENVDLGKLHVSRIETLSTWNGADDHEEFKVYHVKKKKKTRSSSVPKEQSSSRKSSSAADILDGSRELGLDKVDTVSCSSSLTESAFDTNTSGNSPSGPSEDVKESEQPFQRPSRLNEDDLLDSILNIYSRFRDSPEEAQRLSPSEEGFSEAMEKSSVCEENTTPVEEKHIPENTLSEVKSKTYPDVVPDPEPEHSKTLQKMLSEEADIYSSISVSSPAIPESHVQNSTASISPLQSTDCSKKPQLFSEWTTYETPSVIVSICATNSCLYYVDSEEKLFCSSLKGSRLKWKLVKNCPAHRVISSPSGLLLCVIYKGSASVLSLGSNGFPEKRVQIFRDVVTIALDDFAAWIITRNDKLQVKKFDLKGSDKLEIVNCSWASRSIACRHGVLWAVTCHGTVICWNGTKWEEIRVLSDVWAGSISFGLQDTAWLVTSKGSLWFRTGVTCQNPMGMDGWWKVDLQPELMAHSPEHRVHPPSINTPSSGKQCPNATSGTKGLWFGFPQSSQIVASCGNVVGHSWEKVELIGIADTLKWQTIAVVHLDSNHCGFWCLYEKRELFFSASEDSKAISVPSYEVGDIVCLAASTKALWVLNVTGEIYMRKDMSAEWPLGSHWEEIDTSQLGSLQLTHISCSPEIAWGCLENGDVVVRLGPLYSPPGLPLVWLSLDEGAQSPVPSFIKVFVGVGSRMVWGIDSGHSVFVREGIEPNFLIGTKWTPVPGLLALDLCVLKSQVVAVAMFSGELYVRCGISPNNCAGNNWKTIPGSLSHISVSSSDAMWGLSSMGQILRHKVFNIYYENEGSVHTPQSEEDWEFI